MTMLTKSLPSKYASLILVIAVLLGCLSFVVPLYAQDAPIEYQHFNTEMTLQNDGTLHVRMIQQIRFSGSFSQGFYSIPIKNVSSIGNVQLFGAATQEDNYVLDTQNLKPIPPITLENNGDSVYLEWNFPTTTPGDVRLFVIEYDAFGVVWLYPQQDFISWKAVNEDRSGISVGASEVKLTLPDLMSMDQVTTTTNLSGADVSTAGHTLKFMANQSLPDGIPFEISAFFPHGLLNVGMQPWQRAYDGNALKVSINNFDAGMTINSDGSLNLHEVTRLDIIDGALSQGVRTLPLLNIDGATVSSVAVNGQPLKPGEGGCSGCYMINSIARADNWVYLDPKTEQLTVNKENGGNYNIDWYTALPVEAGQPVTTTMDYKVTGTLRINDQNQLLTWQVVPDFPVPAQSATLHLTLPPGVNPDQIVMDAPKEQGAPQIQPDGSLLYHFDGPVVPGAWQFALTLPAKATTAQPPQWQKQFETVMAEADAAAVRHARMTLAVRVGGIVLVVAALLAAVYAWYKWGRRNFRETLGGYISEPPSNRSPAVVSYLVNRKVNEQGILGSIFYLASLRLIEIDLMGEIKLRRIYNESLQSTYHLTDVYGADVPIARHLELLFDQVILPGMPLNEWVTLESISSRLRDVLPDIYSSLASDLQSLYIHVPGSSDDPIPGSVWSFLFFGLMGLIYFEIIPWWIGFIIGFIALFGFVIWGVVRGQGGYTDEGAVEADRWRRFKTYLMEIKKYGDQGAAQEIIDRYFGYAVALGVEDVFLSQATDLGSLRPLWMPDTSTSSTASTTSNTVQSSQSTGSGGPRLPWVHPQMPTPQPSSALSLPRPSLAAMSARLGDSIRQASASMGNLLSTAAGDANSASRSVVINGVTRRHEMAWKPDTPVNSVLDDILHQSVAEARQIQQAETDRREAARSESSNSGGGWSWGSGDSSSSSSSHSSSSFGHTSSSSSFSSSHSSSSSSSSSSHSGGGGHSGFR